MTFKIIAFQFYDRSELKLEMKQNQTFFCKGYSKLTSYTFYQNVLSISMTFKKKIFSSDIQQICNTI